MRLWSIHPKYLDAKGLVALWREALLAQNVLLGKTKGYKNHPQLERFKPYEEPLTIIASYLESIYQEALQRGYKFNRNKIAHTSIEIQLPVTSGQVDYEFQHLLKKLKQRDYERYEHLVTLKNIEVNVMFEVIKGEVEAWEIIH